jgi:Domain of unknown function (DUF6458)
MGIGAGIVLAAIGAILFFAVDADVNGLDLRVVGVILMIAGALGVLLELVVFAPRRRSTTVIDEPRVRTTRETDTY